MLRRLLVFVSAIFVVSFMMQSLAFAGNSSAPAAVRQAPVQVFSESDAPSMPAVAAPPVAQPMVVPPVSHSYMLGVGDRIKLTVYGEDNLSGEYEVGSVGVIALPLIGDIKATGVTLSDFERSVRMRLMDGYLKDPKVSTQIVNYRPFFILGEVGKPGSYPYVNGMTVLNAVALAGGYTYRGDKSDITISHANETDKKGVRVSEDSVVMPGDIIRVPERFF